MKEWEDPIVKEVREAREELMEEAGDLETLFRLLKAGEKSFSLGKVMFANKNQPR